MIAPAADIYMHGVQLNIIGVPPARMASEAALVELFDHSLTQFVYTGDGNVWISPAARASMVSKVIEKLAHSDERTLSRLAALRKREAYKGYSVKGEGTTAEKTVNSAKSMFGKIRIKSGEMFEYDAANYIWRQTTIGNVPAAY